MGKYSNFARIGRDDYATPETAVRPLLPHLKPGTRFLEPCCGSGVLVGHLKRVGNVCVGAFDLPTDACTYRYDTRAVDCFVTNPPGWGKLTRTVLNPILVNFLREEKR
jgi:hypothetical protein